MKRFSLIIITHFKPQWHNLSEEEQAGFAARVRRAAEQAHVTAVVGYTLTTPGSLLEIWEAYDKETLELFRQKLDALGYKKYYDQVLMLGERAAEWIHAENK
jgi:endo-1,4-beta-D-glucanase Y